MGNFELVWWWMLLLLPLPLLVYWLAPSVKQQSPIYLPYLPKGAVQTAPNNLLAKVLATLMWIGIVAAAARPVWYGEPVTAHPKHRDMMLVVDLSGSMAKEDMLYQDEYIDRLTSVKHVVSNFIDEREGDRVGLVLFADHAYLQTPLTLDRHTVKDQLKRTVLNMIGARTAIGEGIGLATKTFVDSEAPQRVMILLSDGSNTAGVLDPIHAANIAKKLNTTIYTVGIGAGEMEVSKFFITRTVNTAKDLDEATLTKIAELTGGQYFRARNSQDLADIYQTINKLEPISQATQTWRPQQDWFHYPLSLAFIAGFLLVMLRRNHV